MRRRIRDYELQRLARELASFRARDHDSLFRSIGEGQNRNGLSQIGPYTPGDSAKVIIDSSPPQHIEYDQEALLRELALPGDPDYPQDEKEPPPEG